MGEVVGNRGKSEWNNAGGAISLWRTRMGEEIVVFLCAPKTKKGVGGGAGAAIEGRDCKRGGVWMWGVG